MKLISCKNWNRLHNWFFFPLYSDSPISFKWKRTWISFKKWNRASISMNLYSLRYRFNHVFHANKLKYITFISFKKWIMGLQKIELGAYMLKKKGPLESFIDVARIPMSKSAGGLIPWCQNQLINKGLHPFHRIVRRYLGVWPTHVLIPLNFHTLIPPFGCPQLLYFSALSHTGSAHAP